jgi:hypothetical protein
MLKLGIFTFIPPTLNASDDASDNCVTPGRFLQIETRYTAMSRTNVNSYYAET